MTDQAFPPDDILEGSPIAERSDGAIEGYGTSAFYGDALYDERGRTSFIKEVVTQVRRCPEYGRYRAYLVENVDMDHCSILSNLSAEEVSAAELEIHHFPLGLYDIAELVLGQMESEGARISTMSVAHRVMAYHWRGMVGLVPLVKTLHEMAHAGQLRVDPRMVHGNWGALLDECRSGVTEHLAEKLRLEAASWNTGEAASLNARTLAVSLQRWTALPVTRTELLSVHQPEQEEADGTADQVLEG